MIRALTAGLLYAAALFAVGFLLGTVRVLLVVPALGELAAVLIELPVMLAGAYFICGWIVRRWRVPGDGSIRAVMGLSFLLFLLALETILGLTLLGRSVAEQTAALMTPAGLAGLAAQVIAAAFSFAVDRRGQ